MGAKSNTLFEMACRKSCVSTDMTFTILFSELYKLQKYFLRHLYHKITVAFA